MPIRIYQRFFLAVEEHPTLWHSTIDPQDSYPALAVRISKGNDTWDTEADFDTGSVECYGSLECLAENRVVSIAPDDIEYTSGHLGKTYHYFLKQVTVGVFDINGAIRHHRTTIICVDDWDRSPFVAINPNRSFLLGRGALLELRPRIMLDFEACSTGVEFASSANGSA